MDQALNWIGDGGIKGSQHPFIRPSHRRAPGSDALIFEAAIQINPLGMTQLRNSSDQVDVTSTATTIV